MKEEELLQKALRESQNLAREKYVFRIHPVNDIPYLAI
jgi:hypothetical protein